MVKAAGDEYCDCSLIWQGKEDAAKEADSESKVDFVFDPDLTVNEDTTKNLYFVGDNLDVLKVLTCKYIGKIRCIYIDPPYNTGRSLLYEDGAEVKERYRHSTWLSMMYPRLLLAKRLLREDGVMFVAIDDFEMPRLSQLLTEIFGGNNVEVMVWHKVGFGDAGAGRMKVCRRFRREHEYIIACYKNRKEVLFNKIKELPAFKHEYGNPDNDPRGPFKGGNISKTEKKSNPQGKNFYTVTSPDGKKSYTRQWHFSYEDFRKYDADNRIYWGKSGHCVPQLKIFLNEPKESVPSSLIENYGSAAMGNKELRRLFNDNIFPNPKPTSLMVYLFSLLKWEDGDIMLDFFGGSSSSAHGLWLLNSGDGIKRRFILVQKPELCSKESAAYRLGYKDVSAIGMARLRLCGEEIGDSSIDVGFKVYRSIKRM